MSVISGIFHEMAKQIPDQAEANQLLCDGLSKDDSHHESQNRKAQAAQLNDDVRAAGILLNGLNDDVQKMSYVLLRSGSNMTLETVFKPSAVNPTLGVSVIGIHKAPLMSFKAMYHGDGRYYLDVDQNYTAFFTSRTFPVDSFEDVEKHLVSNLNHAFNVSPEDSHSALQRLVMNL